MFGSNAFADKKVLITGGGTGIGRHLAETFAAHGARVGVAARRASPLEETCEAIEAAGGVADWKTLDVRDEDRVDEVVGDFWEQWDGIDVLVNNAGANFISPALGISANGWRTVIDINLTGSFLMSKAVGRRMVAADRGGRIINMSATNARGGSPMIAHSGASKAGINSLTESLAVEWGPHNIRLQHGLHFTGGEPLMNFPEMQSLEFYRQLE